MGDISGIRAVMAVKAALSDLGLKRTSKYNGGEIVGWIQPNHFGSTGCSIRARPDGGLDWHVVISGKPHLEYREWTERREDGETFELHEPMNRDRLHPKIKAAFEKLGISVGNIQSTNYQTHWDDDVGYEVSTDIPQWLDTADRSNRQKKTATEYSLCACRMGRSGKAPSSYGGALPAYRDQNGFFLLPRESLDAIAQATRESNRYSSKPAEFSVADDGTLSYKRAGEMPVTQAAKEIENVWGDKVKVWPVPGFWVEPVAEFAPSVPFLMNGEMRTEAGFAEIDAQNGGDAPWLEQPANAPRP